MWGYATGNGADFVHGNFYVEIVGSAESELLAKAMAETAAGFQKNPIAASDLKIAELDLFPPENLVTGSIKLYLKKCLRLRWV